ncbi:formylglycine-generating enzyme family protein [Merismopedia glauca]|uniref:Formylglycine-generating enzyme family protein n=1 Tax=Merismopedia glauca CCAP 1448/3 TaxID=1296344 RepID=A0A2T1C3N1_9CYAN|nr:formylglycine-generating enzyme family protein [Merismopedia glauca]PSB02778.1 formylglycine-generating enzyme family protein [Merismopedia glauca CCAP 1448/3]
MIDRLIAELGEQLELTAEELADIVWLTLIRRQGKADAVPAPQTKTVLETVTVSSSYSSTSIPISAPTPQRQLKSETLAGIAPHRSHSSTSDQLGRIPIKVANPPSIRDPLALVRSLRPLMRLVPSGYVESLDEEATAQQIAEAFIYHPVVKPELEPWLDLILVADESDSMPIWKQTVLEFRKLLRNYGAFRDVQLWGLYWDSKHKQFKLHSGLGKAPQATRQPKVVIDPSGRRLIWLITDCVADYWQDESLVQLLKLWSRSSPVAIAQVFPEWLWMRTAIRSYTPVSLLAQEPGLPNARLTALNSDGQAEIKPRSGTLMPIVPLEANAVLAWSQMVMGHHESQGYRVRAISSDPDATEPVSLSLQQRIERFQVMSSPIAQRLMGLVAATPSITLPVIRLIQETLLPRSRQMNVAEVLLGGLLKPIASPELVENELEYIFVDEGIRDLLLAETPVPDTVAVLSKYIERQFDKSLDDFVADLLLWSQSEDQELVEAARPFATVTAAVLKRKGGKYRDWATQIEQGYVPSPQPGQVEFPPLQSITFETVFVELEEENSLQAFDFEMATVSLPTSGRKKTVTIHKQQGQAWKYIEPLSETVELEMVAIPEGKFWMGSPDNEPQRSPDESPQHEVSVPAFFMGRYPVTQAQWQFVATLPQIERSLDPNPSNFKDMTKPVERVSWLDATEFCARLSKFTGKAYRLPSEAEWEYACRAMTSPPSTSSEQRPISLLQGEGSNYPPFHFGETITPELANYDWKYAYGNAPKLKKSSEGTTPVGQFGFANAFGLSDMHGQVWEWCEDDWHSNYEGAPTDGSAWVNKSRSETDTRVVRGGSWVSSPRSCRSAGRSDLFAGDRDFNVGFRVSCSAPRTP